MKRKLSRAKIDLAFEDWAEEILNDPRYRPKEIVEAPAPEPPKEIIDAPAPAPPVKNVWREKPPLDWFKRRDQQRQKKMRWALYEPAPVEEPKPFSQSRVEWKKPAHSNTRTPPAKGRVVILQGGKCNPR